MNLLDLSSLKIKDVKSKRKNLFHFVRSDKKTFLNCRHCIIENKIKYGLFLESSKRKKPIRNPEKQSKKLAND